MNEVYTIHMCVCVRSIEHKSLLMMTMMIVTKKFIYFVAYLECCLGAEVCNVHRSTDLILCELRADPYFISLSAFVSVIRNSNSECMCVYVCIISIDTHDRIIILTHIAQSSRLEKLWCECG